MPSTKTAAPSGVVKNNFEVFFSNDVERTLGCLTDDVMWQLEGAADVPTVGVRHGKQAVRDWITPSPDNFQPLAFETGRSFENGDQCVVTGWFRHRALVTNKECTAEFAAICAVQDGKIAA